MKKKSWLVIIMIINIINIMIDLYFFNIYIIILKFVDVRPFFRYFGVIQRSIFLFLAHLAYNNFFSYFVFINIIAFIDNFIFTKKDSIFFGSKLILFLRWNIYNSIIIVFFLMCRPNIIKLNIIAFISTSAKNPQT